MYFLVLSNFFFLFFLQAAFAMFSESFPLSMNFRGLNFFAFVVLFLLFSCQSVSWFGDHAIVFVAALVQCFLRSTLFSPFSLLFLFHRSSVLFLL